ncbi:MAG: hypothetical protein RMZ41_024415 [Nostoc sp. DedVER02]|uniref:hypothetical protein n=1 Tax=unclassified Nostoc TaxID=2593658 RepID=UPI002AD46D32|nr:MULTISPECIES: hypothetical protein [unclassified Nostoc]MDZ7987274.1 hypothetical protein [Nostoc sp. DedVER02]MDZ8110782.1 hypothetical protein [Nostoc sp. DedVER01b]
MDKSQELILTKLGEGLPAITPSFGAALAEACAVCLDEQGHLQGVEFSSKWKFHYHLQTLLATCYTANAALLE